MNINEWQKDSKEHGHEHCFHAYRGAIHMVIPDGHVLEKCCKCETTRMVHIDHQFDHLRRRKKVSLEDMFPKLNV